MATHQLPPKTVVQMLKDNNVQEVKLFDADTNTMVALAGSGIEVMVAIPNDQLKAMGSYNRAKDWVRRNMTRFNDDVKIKYVAVGNEPFLTSSQRIIHKPNVSSTLQHPKGTKRSRSRRLHQSHRPFERRRLHLSPGQPRPIRRELPSPVNIYPFLSLYLSSDFPFDYAFFNGQNTINDNGVVYSNVFDANFDTLLASLKALGHGDMTVIVGEVGWPTDGDKNANIPNAERFYAGLLPKLAANKSTPMRPGYIEVYPFGFLDEDAKSIAPGNFERHWGIFKYDGQPKFPADLSGEGQKKVLTGAQNVQYLQSQWCMLNPNAVSFSNSTNQLGDNVNYACTFSDCTALGYGSSCGNLDEVGNASYAFNMYFQVQNQKAEACDFEGLAMITTKNISRDQCNFPIQIGDSTSGHSYDVSIIRRRWKGKVQIANFYLKDSPLTFLTLNGL
ncbi:X8 domain-containing protein [Hirschfeldia incana]|nr:X8 domain-containing protein [Hirschfeldia incana]